MEQFSVYVNIKRNVQCILYFYELAYKRRLLHYGIRMINNDFGIS